MNPLKSISLATMIAGVAIAFGANAAQAFTFTTNYTASHSGSNAWKGNLMLDSVSYGGQTYNDFSLVNRANIVSNDLWTGGNTGAASADLGDLATVGLKSERASNSDIAQALGNQNLSSIIDTEDRGNFAIDLFFDKGVQDILIWERGKNSAMDVQAIDASGNLVGNLLALGKSNTGGWGDAGFKLDTQEIGRAQSVASIGVSLTDFGVNDSAIYGLRVISRGRSYNGPDWKVMGTAAKPTASTPEPFSMVGGAIALGGAALMKRRAQKG